MQQILGIVFHLVGGVASGSFYMPFKQVKKWRWESYWIVGGLFSWLIVPPLAAWLTQPQFTQIIASTPASTIWYTILFGILWILHMAFIILIANMWGIILKEWKGVSTKTRTTIIWGIITIILSVLVAVIS